MDRELALGGEGVDEMNEGGLIWRWTWSGVVLKPGELKEGLYTRTVCLRTVLQRCVHLIHSLTWPPSESKKTSNPKLRC
jgi:hypothetical protein